MTDPEAAVAIVRSEEPEAGVLLMRRADRDGDPWSGHWSFPGGHIEPEDSGLLQTAIRELWEECGVAISAGQLEKSLPAAVARRKAGRYLTVAPFVFRVRRQQPVTVDCKEAVEAQWIPLAMLGDPENHVLRPVPWMPPHILFPTIALAVVPLWGFTYRLMTEWLGLTPPPQASAAAAEELLRTLQSAGVVIREGWREREAVVEGPIPVERVIASLSNPNSHIPPVNGIEVRPEVIRLMGLSFEEYVIRATSQASTSAPNS